MTSTLILLLAGAGAGWVNAVAGGGTLLTFPVLLWLGVDSVRANATSTVGLIVGIVGSLYGYRRHLGPVRPWLLRLSLPSLIGGWAGGLLLTRTPVAWFNHLVPFLLLFATVLFLIQGRQKQDRAADLPLPTLGGTLAQFLIALYGGYFGAGIGILMLATLGMAGLHDLNHRNTVKTVLGALINLVAAAYFATTGLIDWPKALLVAAGAIPGYYLGSRFSQGVSPATVRRWIAGIGLGSAAVLFWKWA